MAFQGRIVSKHVGAVVMAALSAMSWAQAPTSPQVPALVLSPSSVQISPSANLAPEPKFLHFELFRNGSNVQTNFFGDENRTSLEGWNATIWPAFVGNASEYHGFLKTSITAAGLPACTFFCPIVSAQAPAGVRSDSRPLLAGEALPQSESAGLERVLNRMDDAARDFKTVEASVVWDQYQKVVNETETEKGKIYFRREGGEIQMAADFFEPDRKYVVYSGGKVQVYQPKIDQVNEYNPGKNRSDVDSFLVLGFGGGGHDLLKSYEVKALGPETINGVATEKLELIPKSERFRNNIARILLWIDAARGISVQQQLFEPDSKGGSNGDYRLAKYSEIKIKQKLPDDVFKLKTTKKTKFVSPQG